MKKSISKQIITSINSVIKIEKKMQSKINNTFVLIKKLFQENGLSLNKLSDFKYNSYYSKGRSIDLDLAIVKFFPQEKNSLIISINKTVLECLKKLPLEYEVKKNQNYFIITEKFNEIMIKYRTIVLVRNELNTLFLNQKFKMTQKKLKQKNEEFLEDLKKINKIDVKDRDKIQKEIINIEKKQFELNYLKNKYRKIQDLINQNGILQEDLALKVTEAFVKANKITSGVLFGIKKVLNYVLKNQFKYSYNVDMMILTWFYEYLSRSLNDFLDRNFKNSEKELDIKNFVKIKNLKNWFKTHININQLLYFIFSKFGQVNTYYFAGVGFEEYELFKDISRYSLNTNSTFKIPASVFLDIMVFDLKNYEDLNFVQENLSNEEGYSKIIYDKARNEDHRYFVSPLIVSGVSNYPLFSKWIDQTATNLKMKLSDETKTQIEKFRSREAMEEINAIGHNWLASYWAKLKYLGVYFDSKYPLASQFDFKTLILMLTTMVDKTSETNWYLKNDN